jgi:mono/diheme cytochrome c family protein
MRPSSFSLVPAALAALALGGCDNPPAVSTGAPAAATAPADRGLEPAQVARGLAVYEAHCLACHGTGGKGQPGDWRVRDVDGHYPPPPLDDSAHAWHHPTAVLLEVIRDGSPPGEGKMPAWQGRLSEREMHDVVAYIKSLWSDEVYALWWKLEQQSLEP